jgi:hypothetical protein
MTDPVATLVARVAAIHRLAALTPVAFAATATVAAEGALQEFANPSQRARAARPARRTTRCAVVAGATGRPAGITVGRYGRRPAATAAGQRLIPPTQASHTQQTQYQPHKDEPFHGSSYLSRRFPTNRLYRRPRGVLLVGGPCSAYRRNRPENRENRYNRNVRYGLANRCKPACQGPVRE